MGDMRHHCNDEKGGFRNPWTSFSFSPDLKNLTLMCLRDFDRQSNKVTADVKAHIGTPVQTKLNLLLDPPKELLQVTWMGHATFLLQFDQFNILTDPIWSDRCSPLPFAGPKRFVPVPFPIENLPPIDAIIISHDHYDHLDEKTIEALGKTPVYFVPLGLKKWFQKRGIDNVVELDWWQEHQISLNGKEGAKILKATCTPCQHFSGRRAINSNKTLWCSWVLKAQSKNIYFAGNTGYCTVQKESNHKGGDPDITNTENLCVCPVFEEIGKRFGPFDASFIPIGGYSPRYFMSAVHCSPEDAVAIHKAVCSKMSIGMNWGTFRLSDEPILEPPARLKKELENLGIDPETFTVMKHGEIRSW